MKAIKSIYKYIIAAIGTLSFALLFYTNSFKLKESSAKLPRILMLLILLLTLGMLAEAYWKATHVSKKKKRIDEKMEEDEDPEESLAVINYKRAVAFGLMIASYIFLLKPIGYFIITPIFIVGTYIFLKATSIRNMLIIATGFTLFVYLIFVVFLKIPIPLGLMK